MSNTGVLVAIAIAVAACGDSTARNEPVPPPPRPPVVVRTDPATAAECPYGGSVVRSGFDANGNGVLDDAEVANRTVLCDDPPAAPPPPLVVRLVAEPAGVHCTLDGTAVQSGHDRNRNGRLDDDEVEHVDYVCGEPLLTRLAAEPPGPRCIAGGVAFLAGRDRDHDGELGDVEVEQTELVCGEVVSRDVAIQSAADAAALADIAVVGGALTIDGTALAELVLPRLLQVNGALRIANNAALARVALTSLQAVRGALAVERDGELTALELPQLRRVGSLVIDGAGLVDLGGIPLISVDGDVQISNDAALVSVAAPLVQIGGGLDVHGNAVLAALAVRGTDSLGAVRIADNPQLRSVEIPASGTSSPFSLGATTIASNPQLARVAIAAFGIAAVTVADNVALTDVSVQADQIGGDLVLRGNGPLSLRFDGDRDVGFQIGGSLTLAGPVASLVSPAAVLVTGDATFDATGLTALLPSGQVLQAAGALHLIANPVLTTVASAGAGGGLDVRNNAALVTLDLRAGNEIAGSVTIADNPVLQTVPVLDPVIWIRGDVTIARNPALTAGAGGSLARVDGALVLDGNGGLVTPGLAHLAHAGSIELARCPSVTALDLPALSDVTSIDVRNNAGLLHLRLPALRQADLGVFDNPHLPACEVDALFAAMRGDHHQSGNDDTAVCGP